MGGKVSDSSENVMDQGKLTYWEDLFSARLMFSVITAKVFRFVLDHISIQSLPHIEQKAARQNK